jgi:hypothetical protein
VGEVSLVPYYEHVQEVKQGERAHALSKRMPYMQAPRVGAAGLGCNWYDDDRCQINLGKKLSAGASPQGRPGAFMWWSFPKAVQNTKWKVAQLVKSVRAYCLIDEVAAKLAPACKASCAQAIPSMGHYNLCFFNCFFQHLLGPNWNTATSGTAGADPALLPQAFAAAFASCPAA